MCSIYLRLREEMTNILHITEAGGGVIEIIRNIIETDSKNQHTLLVRRRDFSSLTIERTDLGFDVHFWDGHLFKAIKSYRKINRLKNIDIVHLHSSRAGLLRLLIVKPRKVYSPHCFAFERLDIPSVLRLAYRVVELILLRISDGFLAVNASELDWANKRSTRVRTGMYEYVASPGSRIRNTKKIISVGRICTQKNPDQFAQIILSLRQRGLDVEAIWIGDGEKKKRKFLESCGIQVTGWRSSEDVIKHLKTSRVLLHTASWEGLPVVFYEAWSIGLPIIAADASYLTNLTQVNRFQSVAEAVELIELELKKESRLDPKVKSKGTADQELQDFYGELNLGLRLAVNE